MQHEAEMSAEVIDILRSHGTRRAYKKNQIVVSIGDDFENLFLIESGRFSYSIMNAQGDVSIYGYKAAGSTWGLTAAIAEKPAAFLFEAVEDSALTCVHRSALWSLIDSDPVVRRGVILGLGWAVRQAISFAHSQLTLPLKNRLAKFLLENADEDNTVELSQSILARNVGVSRYALGTQLQRLKNQSLIDIEYRRIRLLEPDQLAKIAVTL
ncbi:MAG: Crp/Fnr family transcriptional regulator [Pseudomonadota bacterium]